MDSKEPRASKAEHKQRVTPYRDVPFIDLFPGLKTQIVSAERLTVSFCVAEPNTPLPVHHHEHEQIMTIMEGSLDLLFDGKVYRLEKGDVFIVPSNAEHGGKVSDKGARIIEVFSPPREDFNIKLKAARKNLQK